MLICTCIIICLYVYSSINRCIWYIFAEEKIIDNSFQFCCKVTKVHVNKVFVDFLYSAFDF